jgi:hypothetical protein
LLSDITERGIGRVDNQDSRCESSGKSGKRHGQRGSEKGLEVEQSPREERAQRVGNDKQAQRTQRWSKALKSSRS